MIEESVIDTIKSGVMSAAREAKQLGLRYMGFGRYSNKVGKTTHVVVKGKLERFSSADDVAKHQTSTKDTAKSDFRKANSTLAQVRRQDKTTSKDIGSKSDLAFKEVLKQTQSKIEPEEQETIDWYNGGGYNELNDYLTKTKQVDPEMQSQIIDNVSKLDFIIQKNTAPIDFIAYVPMSVRYAPDHFAKGAEYETKGFMAATLKPEHLTKEAEGFKDLMVVMEIDVRKGQNFFPIDPTDASILLPRDASIKVKSGPHMVPSSAIGGKEGGECAFFKCEITNGPQPEKKATPKSKKTPAKKTASSEKDDKPEDVFFDDKVDQPNWTIDDKGKVKVLYPKKEWDGAKANLSKKDYEKYLNDPFFGVLPHERNEARLSMMILNHKFDEVKKEFPSFKLDKSMLRVIQRMFPEPVNMKKFLASDENEREHLLNAAGGIAHELLVSKDPKGYYDWIEYTEDKIFQKKAK